MGFRYQNLNLIYKALSSRTPYFAHSSNAHLNRSVQALSFRLLDPSLIFPEIPSCKVARRWHVGHAHHLHTRDRTGKEGEKIFRLGLAADIGLATGKVFTGYVSGSTAMIADAVHSVSDVVLSGIALLSFKVARAPKDKEHPYGHGKFETLGALGISGMLLITAGGIAWHALDIILGVLSAAPEAVTFTPVDPHSHHHQGGHHHGIDMNHPVLALNMAIISIVVKEGLFWLTKRAGEREGSGLMKANAWHHRSDAISSVVALVGVGGSILGMKFLDPLAGLLVSGMILKAGIETGYHSILELVDAAVPVQCLDPIRPTILQVEGVLGCHRLRGRKAGSSLYLDVHIEVDPFSSVSAAHDVGEHVRSQIQKYHSEVDEVFIHIDPAISQVVHSGVVHEQEQNLQEMNSGEPDREHIEDVVCSKISSKFSEQMVVEHITRHQLQGKLLLQVEVSMPTNISIRDAMAMADEAKSEILKVSPDILDASMLLHLQHPAPQFQKSLKSVG